MSEEAERATNDSQFPARDRLTRILVAAAVLLLVLVACLSASLWSGEDEMDDPEQSGLTPAPGETVVVVRPTTAPITPPPCEAPEDWMSHTIYAGDTLFTLAQRYDTDVETLKLVNCLESDTIVVGQELEVPGPPALRTAMAESAAEGYFVPAENVQADFPDRYVNILLLGSDKREGAGAWRTDTMIVVTIDTQRAVVRLLSVPRDLWVYIPGHGFDRVNTADLWGELAEEGGGPDLVKETVDQNLGIPIHYYVRADFKGFIKIVDAIGGVDIDVECPLTDIELDAGMHHMDGKMALLYARSRITTNDFDRSRRQRKLLMALFDKGMSKSIIPRLPALWMAMSDTFETDIPLDQVMALAYIGLQIRPNQIFSQSIGPWQVENWTTPQGAEVLLPLDDMIQELLTGFYGEIDFAFLEKVNSTQVKVLNGSRIPQAEQLVATSLGWSGVEIAGTGLADSQDYAQTQVVAYNAEPAIAELVAQNLDLLPDAVQYQPDPNSDVDILVIVGADYDPCSQ